MSVFHDYLTKHHDRFLSEWKDFLRFASVSTDPAYQQECKRCADWVATHLVGLGFAVEIWPTESKPVVFGELPGNPAKPTVLFYGHYDVQPPDPLDQWVTPPFEPELRDGRMFARGAQDNKGQVMFFLKGLEAAKACGVDLPTIKVIIEGEEECGSVAMHKNLHKWREALSAEILMVADTGMVDYGRPTVTVGLRGIAGFEVQVRGPAVDLHSGVFGGIVLNPIHALNKMLSSLFNADGSIAVAGFYDAVIPVSAEETEMSVSAPLDLDAMSKRLGVPFNGGELAYPTMVRRGLRPTIEVNGIGGGYQGPGGKTVIPAFAMAKISIRLVADQDMDTVVKQIQKHLREAAPAGIRVDFTAEKEGGRALRLPLDSANVRKACAAIRSEFACEPVFIWEGGSIPIIPELAAVSGAEPLLVGFGLEQDAQHSPNESFSLRQFEEGYRYTTAFLGSL